MLSTKSQNEVILYKHKHAAAVRTVSVYISASKYAVSWLHGLLRRLPIDSLNFATSCISVHEYTEYVTQ